MYVCTCVVPYFQIQAWVKCYTFAFQANRRQIKSVICYQSSWRVHIVMICTTWKSPIIFIESPQRLIFKLLFSSVNSQIWSNCKNWMRSRNVIHLLCPSVKWPNQIFKIKKCHLEVTPVSKLRSGYISVVCKCNRMPNIINLHLWSPPINIWEWGRLQVDLNCVSGFRVVCKHEEGCASGRHDVTRQWNDRGRRLSSDRRATATSSPCSPHCLSMSMAGETQDIPTGQSYSIKVIQTNWLRALCFPRWLKYDAHCLKLRWADAQLMTPQSSSLNQTHLYFCCFQENLCRGRKESFHLQQDFFLDQTLLCSSIWTHRTHCPCGQCLTNTFKYH